MCVEPLRFGPIEYTEADVIRMPSGLVALPWATRFVLLANEEEWPFAWLQSLDDAALAFVVVPLTALFPEYVADSVEPFLDEAGTEPAHNVTFLGIVVLNRDPERMTVNLLAPLRVDLDRRVAEQLVLEGPLELARQPLAPALAKLRTAV